MQEENRKICLAASAGGHLTQLLKLIDSWHDFQAVYVSTSHVAASKLTQFGKTYIIGECNRQHIFECFKVFLRWGDVYLEIPRYEVPHAQQQYN